MIWNCIIHLMIGILDSILNLKDNLIANTIFVKTFWHLKVTQQFMCFRVNQVYMFLSQSSIFISSPRWIFISSPMGFFVSPVVFLISSVENLLLDLTPEKCWKFGTFPGQSSSPYRGTETGCLIGGGWDRNETYACHWCYGTNIV